MTDLRLRIRDAAGTDHVYTDLDMAEGAVEAGRAYRDGVVERDDVEVRLVAPAVAGYASLVAWPGDRLRAELLDAGAGSVLVDGTVHRTGVAPDDPGEGDGLRTWRVRVLDTALDDLLDALEGVGLRSLVAEAEALGGLARVRTRVRYEGGDEDQAPLAWWKARTLLQAALRAAGAERATVPELFTGRLVYLDGAGVRRTLALPDRGHVCALGELPEGQTTADAASTIPDVTGREWWETLRDLLGLTLRAEYGPWPSAGVVATVTADRWAEPDPERLAALDALGLDLDGWDTECDPAERERFAVRFANDVDEGPLGDARPLPLAARFAGGATVYARGLSADAEAAPLRHPRFQEPATFEADGYRATLGVPTLDAAQDEPYLAWLQDAGTPVALLHYTAERPAPGLPARVNPTWARMLYAGHALTSGDVLRLRVEVDRAELDAAGAPAPEVLAVQYAVEGAGWRTDEVRDDADAGTAALTLVRPAIGYAAEAAAVLVGPPTVYARLDYWATEAQDGEVIADGWEAVATVRAGPGLSAPDRFDVEHSLAGPTGPWEPGDYVDLGQSAGRPAPVHFRARAVYDGVPYTSPWVAATAD